MDRNSREYELCVCKHITRGQVEDFVKENGSTDFKEVCTQMNIGNVCGACRGMIMEIVDEAVSANKQQKNPPCSLQGVYFLFTKKRKSLFLVFFC